MMPRKILTFLLLLGPCLPSLAWAEEGVPTLSTAKEHYIGLLRQDSQKSFGAAPASFALASENLRCEISPTAGNIVRVVHAPRTAR